MGLGIRWGLWVMTKKLSVQELERKLGQQYAQLLKESRVDASVYKDCKEAIDASLGIMEYYNRIALNLRNASRAVGAFSS